MWRKTRHFPIPYKRKADRNYLPGLIELLTAFRTSVLNEEWNRRGVNRKLWRQWVRCGFVTKVTSWSGRSATEASVCREKLTLASLTPNDQYMSRTAPLTSKRRILYIYSTNIGTEYFKHALYSPLFSLQNAVCFIMLTCLVPVLFIFYIQGVLKLEKKIIPAPKC